MDATTQAYSFVQKFNEVILFPTIGLLSAVALLVFMYGCFLYIVRAADPAARAEGNKHIIWGIVGMVVMLSAYTIMSIAAGTFGLQDELDTANIGESPFGTGGGFQNSGSEGTGSGFDNSRTDGTGGGFRR